MCRMLIATGEINSQELFQAAIAMAKDETSSHEFNKANGQGTWLHNDGWGISWIKDNNFQVFKSTDPIYKDDKINNFNNIQSNFLMIHIRKRMGSETDIKNTHPFTYKRKDLGKFIFCHNGFAKDKFNYDKSFKPKGETDSEQLFYTILSKTKTKDIKDSIKTTLEKIETPTGSNIILSNIDKSFIAIKENKYPNYYTMHIGRRKGTTIVASEKLDQLEGFVWEKLNENEMISLDHRNQEINKIKEREHNNIFFEN